MRQVIKTTALTAIATGLAGLPLRAALVRLNVFDVPNHRSSHAAPTPRGGGLAPLAAASTAALLRSRPSAQTTNTVLGLATVGLIDDITGHVPATVRLAAQLVAGGTVIGSQPFAFKALGTSGVVNVVNFMDGINGISGGAAAVWGLNAVTLASSTDDELAALGALTLGAALGFLPHNVPSARLFLGDVGSYSLGAAMAAGIFSQGRLTDQWRVASPLLLYGLDATQAIIRRLRAGQPIGVAHRDHVYQRLVDSGVSHARVATFHAVLAAAIAGAHRLPTRWGAPIIISLSIVYLTAPKARELNCRPSAAEVTGEQ